MDKLGEKVTVDENQRLLQHEAVKADVRNEINSEISRHAEQLSSTDEARAAQVGEQLRGKAMREVESTESEIEKARRAARFSQVVDYVFYLIYGLITLEIFLDLLGARQGNSFREFIDTLSAPVLAPFKRLIADPASGRFQLRLSFIFALIFYILLHLAINGLLRLLAHRKTSV
ncbi:MAG: YggT family protein [Acidobacteriota bacterium]